MFDESASAFGITSHMTIDLLSLQFKHRPLLPFFAFPSSDICFFIQSSGTIRPIFGTTKSLVLRIASNIQSAIPQMSFRFGWIFWREIDPRSGDSANTCHDFTNNLDAFRTDVISEGCQNGDQSPAGWVGCFNILFYEMNFRYNSERFVIHVASSPVHEY
jgi:hypothetical protein